MNSHIFLPGVPLQQGFIHPIHMDWLKSWREAAVSRADDGDIAASICHQATLVDLVLHGRLNHDWLGIMDEHLMDGACPLAYSEKFGKRLYKFESQYRQSTVHALHTRWWIEVVSQARQVDHAAFCELLLAKKQSDGLIYDFDVSPTTIRHRMKSELTLSMAMATEILAAASQLSASTSLELATAIVSPAKCPALGYISMEYFRLNALERLGHPELFPVGIEGNVDACAIDMQFGWSDFRMTSKVDAYMGTAKRTQRDKPIHSPLTACQVHALLPKMHDKARRTSIIRRLAEYAAHLKKYPLDIPAFQMRDVPIPFGDDITPIEIICASHLISQCPS